VSKRIHARWLLRGQLCWAVCVALCAITFGACHRSARPAADSVAGGTSVANSSSVPAAKRSNEGPGASVDPSSYDAEIADLEKQAEKSPSDDALADALSRSYVRRALARRQAGNFREAERDYQNALRHNPDNEEAQQGVADITLQTGREATGENGEPAPLPITPNAATTGEEDDAAPAPDAAPSPGKKRP